MQRMKGRILEAAIKMLASNAAASLGDIAEAAQVSRMTVHRHFKNRDILMERVQDELIARGTAIVEKALQDHSDPVDQLRTIVYGNVTAANGFQLFMTLPHDHHHGDDHDPMTCRFGVMNRYLMDIMEQLQFAGRLRENLTAAWAFHMLNGVLFSAWEALRDGSVAPRDVPAMTWQSFRHGILKDD